MVMVVGKQSEAIRFFADFFQDPSLSIKERMFYPQTPGGDTISLRLGEIRKRSKWDGGLGARRCGIENIFLRCAISFSGRDIF